MYPMTYDEFKRHLGKAGMNVHQFADLTKMNRNSVTNCAQKGAVPTHLAVIAALMGEMAENQLDFKTILSKIDIQPKRPRGRAAKGCFGGSKQIDFIAAKDMQ